VNATGTNEAQTGQLRAVIAGDPVTDDVAFVDFKIVHDTDTCAAPALAEAVVPAEQEQVSAGGGMHNLGDHFFILAPGTYRICVTPLQADGTTPSADCSPTDGVATVMAGMTTETTLVSQCMGPANGGSDTIVLFNHPPLITGLDISASKFILVCESANITVTATDSDGDTLTATWSIVSKPAGSTAPQLVANGFTARFTPDVVGDYTLMVKISDPLGASASLTFPIHVNAGQCFAPDAGPPPPDAPPPPPDAPPPVNILGTWASHVATTGTITVPAVNNAPANIDIVLRIVISLSGANVTNHLEFCRLNTQTQDNPPSLIVNFPTNVLALMTNDQTIPASPVFVGGPVPIPAFDILVGCSGACASIADQVDSDADGHPGVSLPATLAGTNLIAYSGLHITTSFPTATLTDPNTINGTSAIGTSGTVFGGAPLNLTGPIAVTPTNPTTAFTATHLAGDVPCSQVLTMFP
jgi:hypothetical protein